MSLILHAIHLARDAAKINRLVRRDRVVIEGPMTGFFQGLMWEATVEGSQPLLEFLTITMNLFQDA